MNSIILAAGYGKRFKLKKFRKPKCLLKIYKKNLLYHLINNLLINKVEKIFIVIGYKKDLIVKYVKENFKTKNKIIFIENQKFKKYGNSYSAFLAANNVFGSTLLLNADIITPKNSIKKLISNKKKNLFLTNSTTFFDDDDITFAHNKRQKVKEIYVKEKRGQKYKNFVSATGVAKFSKDSFKKFRKELKKLNMKKSPYWEIALKGLIKKNEFFVFPQKIKTLEIDTKSDYTKALKILKNKNEYL